MLYVTYLKQKLLKENFSVWLILAAPVTLVARSAPNCTPGPKLLVNSKCPSLVNSMPRQPGRATISWGAPSTALPASWEKVCSALHRTGVASHWLLCAVLGTTIQKGRKTIWECPKEGYKDSKGSRDQGVWGVAVVPWFPHPGAEEAERTHRGLQLLVRGVKG